MRIGIEAQRIFRKHKHGMDRVAVELINNLQKMDTKNEYFIFVKPGHDAEVIKPTPNFKIIEISGGPYPLWEQYKLVKQVKAYQCDVLHCTSNTAPLFVNIPLVTTLHDIIFMEGSLMNLLRSGAMPYQKFGNVYRRMIVPNIVKKSTKLITVSNFEKENISSFFKMKNDKLDAIHNGIGPQFTSQIDAQLLIEVRQKHKLPEHYFLHMANKDPRKNTKMVLKGFNQFLKKNNLNTSYKLVLLGYTESDLKETLNVLKLEGLEQSVVLLGYINDAELPAIYALSDLFLFPSLREGFGIPIIEAMGCGVPVITSNNSAMPEVAGEAAHLIHSSDENELTHGMLKISNDKDYKTKLISKGLERSKQFTWQRMASKVLKIYQELDLKLKN